MQRRRRHNAQARQTNEKPRVEMRVLRVTVKRGTRAARASRNTCQRNAKHRRKSEEASGTPKATSTQGKAPAGARERDKECNGTDGEEAWDSADEALISDAARARRPDNMQIHHLQQTNPSADVSQKLLNTAPERKGRTQDVDSCGIHAEYIYPDIHAGPG